MAWNDGTVPNRSSVGQRGTCHYYEDSLRAEEERILLEGGRSGLAGGWLVTRERSKANATIKSREASSSGLVMRHASIVFSISGGRRASIWDGSSKTKYYSSCCVLKEAAAVTPPPSASPGPGAPPPLSVECRYRQRNSD